VLKGEDKAAIEEKSQALAMASQKLGEKNLCRRAGRRNRQGAAPQPEAAGHAPPRKEEGQRRRRRVHGSEGQEVRRRGIAVHRAIV